MAVKLNRLWGSATLALAVAALAVPSVASAQERGWGRDQDRSGGREERAQQRSESASAQEGRAWRGRSAEARAPQAAPAERPAWGGRNDQSRGNGGEARAWGRNGGNPASQGQGEARGWAGRQGGNWQQQQSAPVPSQQAGSRWGGRQSSPQIGNTDQSRVRDWAVRQEQMRQQNADRARSGAWGGSNWNDRNQDGRRDGNRADRNRDGARDGNWTNRNGTWSRDGSWNDRNRTGSWTNRNGTWSRDNNRYSDRDFRNWDRRWRDNNRYNWYSYRRSNPSIYQWGSYYSPYRNYSYRRISIGFTLQSLFYGERYWINDPWQYRLPDVYGPYRWVRYYDDALLVNVYDGEVVDVIYDFFW